jgi:hypothetical protein
MRKITSLIAIIAALTGSLAAKEGSPEEQVAALFKQLASEKRSTAFQEFFAGSLAIAQKPAEVRAMDAQAGGAWTIYGAPESYEILDRREVGKSLFRIRWLTKNKDEVPLFWSALFYLRAGKWEALSLVFFDQPEKAGL